MYNYIMYVSIYIVKKTNDTISYIPCQSNNLPSIIKNLPKGIEMRLSTNPANADIFQEAAKPYNNVLKNNGHKESKNTRTKELSRTKENDPKNLSPSQIIQKKTTTKREERRSPPPPPPPPHSTETLNVATNICKKNSSHYSALASQLTTSFAKS